MARIGFRLSLIGVAIGTVFYQFFYKPIIVSSLGYNRELEPFNGFGVKCKKVDKLGLAGCADMWLHQETGMLYLACSDSTIRRTSPVDISSSTLTGRIALLDTRGSGSFRSRLTWIQPQKSDGEAKIDTFNIHGFDVREDSDDKEKLHIIFADSNSSNGTSKLEDASTSSNAIEYFTTKVGSDTMTHVQTFSNSVVESPNHVAWVDDQLFMFTNAKRAGVASRGYTDVIRGGGAIGYCTPPSTNCAIAKTGNLNMPNGLSMSHDLDNLLYVPSSVSGQIQVFSMKENQQLRKVDTIQVPYPINDISVDKNGDIYAATVPILHKALSSQNSRVAVPSAVFRIMKLGQMGEDEGWGWNVVKVIEDDGEILPAITSVVHDSKTGKLYLGGAATPFLSICEKKDGSGFSAPLQMFSF